MYNSEATLLAGTISNNIRLSEKLTYEVKNQRKWRFAMTRVGTAAKFLALFLVPAMIMAYSPSAVFAQEHPEHPAKKEKAEHPEHPEHPEKASVEVDVESIAMAIGEYVEGDCKLKGGFFFVFDPVSKSPLTLTLTKIHKEKLAQIGDNLFFACSDFDAQSGKVFDLDFFMKAKDGQLVVTEVMIHKEDGNPRYSWFEEEGIWRRK